jgi:integrase
LITPAEFAKVQAALPEHLRPLFIFMYSTGCRLGAAQAITWSMVNRDATEINIPGEFIKNDNALKIILAGALLEPVANILRKFRRTSICPGDARVFDATNFRPEWSRAVAQAGLGTYDKKTRKRTGVRIHDGRVSFASNAVGAGIPQDDIMKMGGWKTSSTFSRYNIVPADRLRRNAEQSQAHVEAQMNVKRK